MTLPLHDILFLDIETVPQYPRYSELSSEWKTLWDHKASSIIKNKEAETPESIYNRAGIYAEFGKIICITCGIITKDGEERNLTIKSFFNTDEKLLLLQFSEMLNKWSAGYTKYLCAHNGKEFDFPYLCRRYIINYMPIPALLQLSGKKPWEVPHLDTLEYWKFGDYKSYTSLNLLAHTMSIPTPKDDIDGSQVWKVYWEEENYSRIANYCQKDVITLVQIYLHLNGLPLIKNNHVLIKEP